MQISCRNPAQKLAICPMRQTKRLLNDVFHFFTLVMGMSFLKQFSARFWEAHVVYLDFSSYL